MRHNKLTIICIASAFALTACGGSEPDAMAPAEEAAAPAAAEAAAPEMMAMDLVATLAAAGRSDEDMARDAGRKPAEVLELFGVESGMDVIDLLAAGGWYSEVLAAVVGDSGSVAAQNPPFILGFNDGAMGTALTERIGDRLTNVTRVDSSWAELGASGAQYDFAMSALNVHDTYYMQSPEISAEFIAAVFTVLKPGGVFGVIDHAGNADGANGDLHRINKDVAIELATAAGFVVEVDSDLLGNAEDDHTQGVFSPGVRGNTDRFILKLRKPAG
jgi:predicted methyltransferase